MAWRVQPKLQTDLPFRALWGHRVVDVVGVINGLDENGLDEIALCYALADGSYAPLTLEPVDVPQEVATIFATFRDNAPQLKKEWRRQGFFATGLRSEIQRKSPDEKAAGARAWLQDILKEPTPARQVLERATAAGFSVWAMYRAKDFLGAKSICVTGLRRAEGWVWALPENGR